nr:hypothetical protein [Tanacetum cinerariifolium]
MYSWLCPLFGQKLEYLDISDNTFDGNLSEFLNTLSTSATTLESFDASGRIPPSIGYLGQIETLCLYHNSFCGELPLNLKNCTELSLLDLGANNLYGNVPVGIRKNMSRLYALSLKSNNLFGTIPSQICQLESLQILDLSFNNLHGTIPPCMNNLTSMVKRGSFLEQNKHHSRGFYNLIDPYGFVDESYIDHLLIEWQGKVNEFSSILGLLKVIDLSSNNLTGQIPNEVANLHGLNMFSGEIPPTMSEMTLLNNLDMSFNDLSGRIPLVTQLQTFNASRYIGNPGLCGRALPNECFSYTSYCSYYVGRDNVMILLRLVKSDDGFILPYRNMFSGEIPPTMSQMTLLNNLDMSFNDLSGRIPLGTQLQSFDASRYIGNPGLCGRPLPNKCSGDEDLGVPPVGESDGDGESTNELQRWFYIGGATGFATAFWIACSALLFNRRLRHAFFHFQNCLKDWVYVKVAVLIAKFQRAART